MKKLVFAAIAALVMVSVSNVFASNEVTPAQDSTAATPAESTDSAATAE